MHATATAIAAEAIFASHLQPSDGLTAAAIATAVQESLELFGEVGCACVLATEYGEHPDIARNRMRWALTVATHCEALPGAA